MTKLLWLSLLLSACAHQAAPPLHAEEDAALSRLDRGGVDTQLTSTLNELASVDERLRSANARLNLFELQAAAKVQKEDAVEGARAEIANLQARRGQLLHRQHVLEARQRELNGG